MVISYRTFKGIGILENAERWRGKGMEFNDLEIYIIAYETTSMNEWVKWITDQIDPGHDNQLG
jgi:hypothetical protein